MKIYQRRNGRFIVDYLEEGVKRQKSFAKKEDAETFLQQLSVKQSGITVEKCINSFIKERSGMSCRRIKEYEQLIKHNGFAEILKDVSISNLKEEDLNTIHIIGIQQGLLPQTINYKTGLLRYVFKWAWDTKKIKEIPWTNVKRLKSKRGSYNASPDDFLKIYKELPDWAQWACRTCIALCLRPGKELFGLNWSDFNWDAGTVKVYMPKTKRSKIVYPPKEYLEEACDKFKQSNVEYVIPSILGVRAYSVYFDIVWQKTRERLGIDENVKPYCMRHISATGGVINGATTSIMGAQLGHSHPMFTQLTYIHTTANREELEASREFSVYNNFFVKN